MELGVLFYDMSNKNVNLPKHVSPEFFYLILIDKHIRCVIFRSK